MSKPFRDKIMLVSQILGCTEFGSILWYFRLGPSVCCDPKMHYADMHMLAVYTRCTCQVADNERHAGPEPTAYLWHVFRPWPSHRPSADSQAAKLSSTQPQGSTRTELRQHSCYTLTNAWEFNIIAAAVLPATFRPAPISLGGLTRSTQTSVCSASPVNSFTSRSTMLSSMSTADTIASNGSPGRKTEDCAARKRSWQKENGEGIIMRRSSVLLTDWQRCKLGLSKESRVEDKGLLM